MWTEVSLGQLTCEDYGESGEAFSSTEQKELWQGKVSLLRVGLFRSKGQAGSGHICNLCLIVIVWQAQVRASHSWRTQCSLWYTPSFIYGPTRAQYDCIYLRRWDSEARHEFLGELAGF